MDFILPFWGLVETKPQNGFTVVIYSEILSSILKLPNLPFDASLCANKGMLDEMVINIHM